MIIYEFNDYKKYLNSLIESYPKRGRGVRLRLAEAAQCQVAYVSQVLSGSSHFSLEQAEGVSRFFNLTQEETEYFFLLVQYARAGTPSLRENLQRQIEKRASRILHLKTRVKIERSLNVEDQARYYSTWHYAAVHMALTIPSLRTADAIARYLDLSVRKVNEVLEFLLEVLLVEFKEGRYQVTESLLHLESHSPLIHQHHTQWRLKALSAMSEARAGNATAGLHYSLCFSISKADAARLKNHFAKFIQSCAEMIQPSPEEKLYSMGLDLFEVGTANRAE